MNLGQKIYKLRSAVWDYRGKHDPQSKVWIKVPKPSAKKRVEKCLERLGINTETGMGIIDALQTKGDFDAWLVAIRLEKESLCQTKK